MVLKNLPTNILTSLVHIYTACINLHYTPIAWKHSKTVFIPKIGKDDYSQPRAYRPISLTSFLFKALERLVLWHIEETTTDTVHHNQHAFRKGHSTEIALNKVVNKIETAFFNNEYCIGVFLDIEGAYDNIDPQAIIDAMHKHKLPIDIILWFQQYTHHRTCEYTIGGDTIHRETTTGVTQGGVSSPNFYSYPTNNFLEICERESTHGTGFADDGAVLESGHNIDDILQKLQHVLNKIQQWASQVGLKFSISKTKVIIFTRKKIPPLDQIPCLQLYNTNLAYDTSIKYLGITVDNKCSFKPHLQNKLTEAKIKLLQIRNATGKEWGPKPFMMRWLYTGVIRPAITYGCLIWAKATNDKMFKEKAQKLQRLALLHMAPFRTKSPTIGLEMLAYIPPLDIFILGEALNAFIRLFHLLDTSTNVGMHQNCTHITYLCSKAAAANILHMPTEIITPYINFSQPWETSLSPFKPAEAPNNCILIYTDGSKITRQTGAGWLITHKLNETTTKLLAKNSQYLGTTTTVFQAEMFAILQAAETCLDLINNGVIHNQNIFFITDSQASIKALNKNMVRTSLLQQCTQALQIISSTNTISLQWIKAHVGHEGNEEADTLAKMGAYSVTTEVEPILPVSRRWIRSSIEDFTRMEWRDRWISTPTARQTKIFLQSPSKNLSRKLLQHDRITLGELGRWILGHNFLLRHNHLLDPYTFPSPTCRQCQQEEETSSHLILECEALGRERYKIFGQHLLLPPFTWTPDQLVKMIQKAKMTCPEIFPNDN
jgi:ribonuclease HI